MWGTSHEGTGGGEDGEDVQGEGDGNGGDPMDPRSTALAREKGKRVRGEEKRDALGWVRVVLWEWIP